jgi:hypothetical protein
MLKIKSTTKPENPAKNFNEWMQFIKNQIENEKKIKSQRTTSVHN